MRILLTGASGFIGQALLNRYGSAHEITVLGRSAGKTEVSHRLVGCDLNDPAAVQGALEGLQGEAPFDAIVHMAVSRLHRTFPETALDLFNVNTVSTAYLMNFAWRSGAGHVVLGSTGSVYNLPDGVNAAEDAYTRPKSYFAASKLAADSFAEQYRPLLPVSILRFFVPYGPGLEDRMLSNLAANILAGRPVLVPQEGPALTFAPLYCDDAIRTIETCLAEIWNETVNVATDEALPLDAAARMMGAHLGVEVEVTTSPDAGPFYLVPDITRLRARMDVDRFTRFDEGARRMLAAAGYTLSKAQ